MTRSIGASAFLLLLVIACAPTSAAGRDGCPDPDPDMDYCGLCKSTDKCHYCPTGACVASDPCACGAAPVTCGPGTHADNGVCVLDGTGGSSGSSSSSGGSSGDIGLPCTTNAHPAWQNGECSASTTCKLCSVRACARVTQQGCCAGEDTPSEFFPCNGCQDCTAAVQSALQRCGCTQ